MKRIFNLVVIANVLVHAASAIEVPFNNNNRALNIVMNGVNRANQDIRQFMQQPNIPNRNIVNNRHENHRTMSQCFDAQPCLSNKLFLMGLGVGLMGVGTAIMFSSDDTYANAIFIVGGLAFAFGILCQLNQEIRTLYHCFRDD